MRIFFVADHEMTFHDLVATCKMLGGFTPEHAHVMPAGRVVGGPDHIDFWHWAPRPGGGYEISHDLPSWETGEKASWGDIAVSAGDGVSLDSD